MEIERLKLMKSTENYVVRNREINRPLYRTSTNHGTRGCGTSKFYTVSEKEIGGSSDKSIVRRKCQRCAEETVPVPATQVNGQSAVCGSEMDSRSVGDDEDAMEEEIPDNSSW